ncbi:MAG: M36 family metallopeptidase [Candidatus Hermodarchaeota archaeon]
MEKKIDITKNNVFWYETEKRPRKVRGKFTLPKKDKIEDSIKEFLHNNAEELSFKIKNEDLKVIQDVSTPTKRILRFQQYLEGIPIYGAKLGVHLDKNSRITQLDLSHKVQVNVKVYPGGDKLSTKQALKIAMDSLGDFELRQEIKDIEEIYYPSLEGLKLCYMILIPTRKPLHDWRIIIDVFTGDILAKEDIIVYFPDGEGSVFNPNPVVTANNNTFRDPNATIPPCTFTGTTIATIDAECEDVTLKDITSTNGTYKLEGPYVKMRDFGPPAIAPPEEANANNFKYSSNDAEFEAVMVYYHVDTIQRYIQSLGITTAHNKQIEADAHDEHEYAWFSPIDGGIHFGDSGQCKPDRGEDADAIVHEYGHAIQHDQVPNWGNASPITGRYETRAMGEGFCDILACVYFSECGGGYQREVFEDWCFADESGMRRVDGNKVYPTDWANNVHADGEIWSAALWNIYLAIGGDSNNALERTAARDELLKTVIMSHHSVADDATMPDGAEAFMDTNSEDDAYLGRHLIEMLDSFHDRGIIECSPGSDLKISSLWSQVDDSSIRSHENVEAGQDNWFFAEINNNGGTEARAFVVTFSFVSPFHTPIYPNDFRDNIISAVIEYNLGPGQTRTVWARWPRDSIPPLETGSTQRHGCIFAEVYNPEDHVPEDATTISTGNGKIRYRNTNIIDMVPDETADYYYSTSNYNSKKEELIHLEVIRPKKWENLEIVLLHHDPNVITKMWGIIKDFPSKTKLARKENSKKQEIENVNFLQNNIEFFEKETLTFLKFRPGHRVFIPYLMKPRDRTKIKIRIRAPKDAKPGDKFNIEFNQYNMKKELIGGFDIQVNIKEEI